MISDDLLIDIVKNSISYSDAMRKCGQKPRGASYQFFKQRLKKLQLDTSHFLGKAAGAFETNKQKKRRWQSILVTSRMGYGREKSRILRRAFQEYCHDTKTNYQCSICGLQPFWNNQALDLQIDHINNQHFDNCPANLRWICPNCHFQKSQQQSRDSYKRYFCSICGKEYPGYGRKCNRCHLDIMNMGSANKKMQWPDSKKMQELVNSKPLVEIAKLLNVGYSNLRKYLKTHNILTLRQANQLKAHG